MHPVNLRTLDLNLLKTFDALERERSVTRAADCLGLGQPAVSQALGRLRAQLQDDLFVRGASGMEPTVRARALIGPIREALRQVEIAIYGDQAFEAADYSGCFTIGLSDFVAAAIMPELLRLLAGAMPSASLVTKGADKQTAPDLLLSGEIDLAIGMFPVQPDWLSRKALFQETHVCVFNPRCLPCDLPISLAQYVAHPHVLVSLKGDSRGFIDDLLEQRGLKRRIAVTTPYFLLAGHLLKELPVLATLPRSYARQCATTEGLAICPVPLEVPTFDISLLSRTSDQRDPAMGNLISLVRAASASIGL